ncbi:hypothetical protein [Gimesia fumaroli]|uniref:Uncharacterized protein n=1 Tax=Gimesia fumaroli TaxID=2527976 RepID=A0A518IKW1_9PLAN|nr:hypothetical protein [Gimesia fumaroli]QDV53722.1 hypothetical protein Enr17x_58030 [Gimesia fumaroli]
MSSFKVHEIRPCLKKVLQDCGSEIRNKSVFLDVHFLKPVLQIDLHNIANEEIAEIIRDYCYELAGKFREAGMNIQKQLDESAEQPLSELIPPNVHFAI